jgi:hypothetical protein
MGPLLIRRKPGGLNEGGVDRGKTVTKPFVLSLLELPSSEKQTPQDVEILKSGGNLKKLWRRPKCAQGIRLQIQRRAPPRSDNS